MKFFIRLLKAGRRFGLSLGLVPERLRASSGLWTTGSAAFALGLTLGVALSLPLDLRAQCCVDISGMWQVEESVTATIYLNGELEEVITRSGTAPVLITQSGCNFSFTSEAPNPIGDGVIRLTRTGTITGNTASFTGRAASSVPGATCSTNVLTGNGPITSVGSNARLSFTTRGQVYCVGGGDRAFVLLQGRATFTASRVLAFPPLVSVEPAAHRVSPMLATDGTLVSGSNTTFTARVTGTTGALAYQWLRNGRPILRATNAALVLTNVRCADAGLYSVRVRHAGCELTSAPSALWFNDSTNAVDAPPTLTVTMPRGPFQRVSNNLGRVEGTAKDDRALAGIYLQQGVEPFHQISQATNWAVEIPLIPGTNLVRVKAVDRCGQASPVVMRTLYFVVTEPLTVRTNGSGSVTPALNGQLLEIGSRHTLMAVPASGWLFSHWSGGVTGAAPKMTFTMSSNLVIEANFVPNPFLAVAGNYHGLYYDPYEVQHGSSGFVTATIQPSGAFTGSLQTGTRKQSFSGRFDLEGRSALDIRRPGTNALELDLFLDFDRCKLHGRLTDGVWDADLLANRAGFNARTHPATELTNKFTFLIPGGTNANEVPAGHGFGAATVALDGSVTLTGSLADGTPFAQKVPLSKSGDWPLYVSLYGGQGSLFGWLQVLPTPDPDVAGHCWWFRPPMARSKLYTNGFALAAEIEGSVYRPLGTNRALPSPTAWISFSEGNLSAPFTNRLTLGPNARMTNTSSNPLTLMVTPASGLFTGSVTPPGASRAVPFRGVLLQENGVGDGFFLGTNQSGRVEFVPDSPPPLP